MLSLVELLLWQTNQDSGTRRWPGLTSISPVEEELVTKEPWNQRSQMKRMFVNHLGDYPLATVKRLSISVLWRLEPGEGA